MPNMSRLIIFMSYNYKLATYEGLIASMFAIRIIIGTIDLVIIVMKYLFLTQSVKKDNYNRRGFVVSDRM